MYISLLGNTIKKYVTLLKNLPFCPVTAFIGDIIKAVYRTVTEKRPYSTHGYNEIINYFRGKNIILQLSTAYQCFLSKDLNNKHYKTNGIYNLLGINISVRNVK
jgi:hypothetical protein